MDPATGGVYVVTKEAAGAPQRRLSPGDVRARPGEPRREGRRPARAGRRRSARHRRHRPPLRRRLAPAHQQPPLRVSRAAGTPFADAFRPRAAMLPGRRRAAGRGGQLPRRRPRATTPPARAPSRPSTGSAASDVASPAARSPAAASGRSRWPSSIRSGGRPRQNTCHSGKRARPSHCLAYQGVMGLSGRDRQKNAGVVADQHRPQIAADAFALGRALDRELRQVGADGAGRQQRRAQVVLLDVDPLDPALEGLARAAAAEGRLEQHAQARPIDAGRSRCGRSMREPLRIRVPAPLTVNSSRSSASGLTTATLIRCGTSSSSSFTWRSSV